jgi:hypothetical protein
MFRCWLIRGTTLTLLTLCVVAWVGSYFQSAYVQYMGGGRLTSVRGECGLVWVSVTNDSRYITGQWDYDHAAAEYTLIRSWYQETDFRGLGFAYRGYESGSLGGPTRVRQIWIPLWFPTLVSTLLLFLVWRKTRPKYHGNAFPIEPPANE